MQIIQAPSGDPDRIFYVRKRSVEGEVDKNFSINIQTIQMIAKEARLPNTAIENHHPELFEAIA